MFRLYDQRGAKHVGMQRGEEPDYKMYFLPDGAYSDNGAGMLAEHADGNYFHEVLTLTMFLNLEFLLMIF